MGYVSEAQRPGAGRTAEPAPWSLVVDLLVGVWRTGSWMAGVRDGEHLAVVRLAADQAARLLGATAQVDVVSRPDTPGPPFLVTVSFLGGRPGWRRAQGGLDALLRAVRRQQGRPRRP